MVLLCVLCHFFELPLAAVVLVRLELCGALYGCLEYGPTFQVGAGLFLRSLVALGGYQRGIASG